jgi:hypothetical protein
MSNDPEKVVSRSGVRFRKFIFPLMRLILIIANPYKLHIVRKAEVPKGKPVIYASTHGFKDDVLNAVLVAGRPMYMQGGALGHFYNSIDGVLAWLIGVVLVDRADKESRVSSIPKLHRAMEFGMNTLIFPEGAWNLTDSLLVMKLYRGVYRLAVSTKAFVVPIATLTVGKNCYAALGEPLNITKYECEEGLGVLRDELATLKYAIMKEHSSYSRNDLEKGGKTLRESWEETKRQLVNEAHHSTQEQEYKELRSIHRYIDKNITEYTEAFAHLCDIEITTHNAFLLRPDRLEYPHFYT